VGRREVESGAEPPARGRRGAGDRARRGVVALALSGTGFADVTGVCGTLAQHVGSEPEVEEHGPHRLVFLVPAAAPWPGGLAAAADELAAKGLSVRVDDRGTPGRPGPWEVVVVEAR
jgi:hypothetical protein